MSEREQSESRYRIATANAVTRALGYPEGYLAQRRAFLEDTNALRRLFAELLGTFLLVLVAAGAPMVAARFPSHALSPGSQAALPGFAVAAMILAIGAVSGAHLNPAVTLAFALRHDFPWKRVAPYIITQLAGSVVAVGVLVAIIGRQGAAGATLPGAGIGSGTAMLWELVLTVGLVTVILGTASGAQNVGPLAAIGVGSYIALAGAWGAPVSGASMNPARSFGPQLVLNEWHGWWVYVAGPVAGALVAVAFAWALRGPGGGLAGRRAAQGGLGWEWGPGPINPEPLTRPDAPAQPPPSTGERPAP